MGTAVLSRRRSRPTSLVVLLVLALLAAWGLAATATPASAAPVLLSQGKPVTASSTENVGTPASAAVDGVATTRWASAQGVDPQWLQVDLGAPASISAVTLNWEAAYARAFTVQTSNDGTTWTSVYSTTTGTGGTQTLAVTGSGRYVRVLGTTRATPYGYSLYEFQVQGTAGTPTTSCGTANAAQGRTATASSSENTGTPASAAVDGVATTRWASAQGVDPQWLQVDLGSVQAVCRVTLTWEAAYATAFSVQVSSDGTTWTSVYSTTTGTGGTQTLAVSGTGRYVRVLGTTRATPYGYSLWEVAVGTTGGGTTVPAGCPVQSDTPDLGPNVAVFDPSTPTATIQARLDSVFEAQKLNQFGTRRDALLFKPGTYGVEANIGYYTSIAGLGQNPGDVTINGHVTVDAFDGTGNATQNFWRSTENLAVNPSGSDRWAVAQAAPFRRMDIRGNLDLFPASYGWASGGYIADSKVSGRTESASQQQWYTRDSSLGSWSGSNWNMVFSGVAGAPAQSFPNPPMTTLATTPVSRDVPYLYVDGAGKYRVFLPALRTNATGPSWAAGSTPGSSLPMSQFYVVKAGDTSTTINRALDAGCNLFVTPGVYHLDQTLRVTKPGTVALGIGMPTFIPDGGVTAMTVADVDGVRLKGLLFDAGTTNSPTLLTVGTAGSTASHAADPTTIQDVFFRIGGDIAGKATNSLTVNSNDTIIDHIWAWRADHGNAGTYGWTVNTADNGLTVNGNNVLATGLFVEHYQKYEVLWNGQNGRTIFFQNEMPYDPPNQAAFMNGTSKGWAAYKVADSVTTHEAWGVGSYCYFNIDPTISADRAFEVPVTPGVKFHDLLTVSLGGNGTINRVINNTGGPAAGTATIPSFLVSFP